MLPKQLIRDYFTFSRKDRIGVLFIVLVIGGSLLLPSLLAPVPQPLSLTNDSALVLAMDTLHQRSVRKPLYRTEANNPAGQPEPSINRSFVNAGLFRFDPNTASLEDWQRLGLNERTSKTILKYVSKGGRFHNPEDLLKIWSMPQGFYERVKDYIAIATVRKQENSDFKEKMPTFERGERRPAVINVNEADTSALIALPGIGSKLSGRIIAFREKLGGFYSVEQVGETYGLPDSTFQKIRGRLQVNGTNIRKINVNMATKDELKEHPYIRWHLANAIVEYRNQHGAFKSLEELKNIVLFDVVTYNKIVHYLDLE